MENKTINVNRVTPEMVTELDKNQIFVFGSNESGIHGAGAARLALNKFGALYGKSSGLQGKCYAIPTKSKFIERTLTIEEINAYVKLFIVTAKNLPTNHFLVTEIGCGLAGHNVNDIAPLFTECINMDNVSLPQRFWDILINNN